MFKFCNISDIRTRSLYQSFQISDDIMTNVVKTLIEGVDSLFQQPAGCGEQTMIRLAPTVYAMMYIKETRQITEDIEIRGNQWIRDGMPLVI